MLETRGIEEWGHFDKEKKGEYSYVWIYNQGCENKANKTVNDVNGHLKPSFDK